MKPLLAVLSLFLGLFTFQEPVGAQSVARPAVSSETQACVDCHENATPGIVADWLTSHHAHTSVDMGLAKPAVERRVSATSVADELKRNVVGCYECHTLRKEKHLDAFDHFGYTINVIVSPADCQTCHPTEVEQFSHSKKAHAVGNLMKNPVYSLLVETVTRPTAFDKGKLRAGKSSGNAKNVSCLSCHGTVVEVKGMRSIETEAGLIEIPNFTNWPNMGVGRANPDGSLGSCTACHPRHSFAIEIARKPETCGQCHLEPDVPAYNVYKESKHGNIVDSRRERFIWDAVPWTAGKDFTAPTCAVCHNALVTTTSGMVVAERSHDFGARLWVRLFGLVYSHPQPVGGETHNIVNADKLPLPTTFGGTPAATYLISREEQKKRQSLMRNVCGSCHTSDWAERHFTRIDTTASEADAMVATSTQVLADAWGRKLADKANPFDEPIEQEWVRQWLFHANTLRLAAAMSGQSYAAFEYGWWELNHTLYNMEEMIQIRKKVK